MSEIERYEPLDDEYEAWDMLPGESTKAFELFRMFRDLGPRRTYAEVARATGMDKRGISVDYGRKNAWLERARAYDLYLDRKARAELEAGVVDARNRHVKIAMELQDKVAMGLAAMDPLLMTPKDLVYALDVAIKLEQRARGDNDTKRVEFTGKDGGPIEVVNKMSSAERNELLVQVQSAIAKQLGVEAAPEIIEGEVVEDDDVA